MCSCPDLAKILILPLLIRISVAGNNVGLALDKNQKFVVRITREVTSDTEESTTLQPQSEGPSTTSNYEDDVESSTFPYSLDLADAKEENANETGPGLNRLLGFLLKNKYNSYEIHKINMSRTVAYEQGDPETFPVGVEMHLSIRSVSDIDEINEFLDIGTVWWDHKLNEWYYSSDPRLQKEYRDTWPDAENYVALESKVLEGFWSPDISIERLAKVTTSKVLSSSERLKFRLNGGFHYVKRVTMKVKCEMDYTYYPADTQKCDFILRSYSYNSSDLTLWWRKPEGVYLMQTNNPNFDLQINNVTRYNVSVKPKKECLKAITNRTFCDDSTEVDPEQDFDVLRFTLRMRRRISYQLLQTYIPSALYIAITWLCFMIPPRLVEGRMAISMTTLLTLTSMFASVRENTPIVSYIKAIDIWMAAGIVFIFLNLLEFTVLLWTEFVEKDEQALQLETSEREGDEEHGHKRSACTKTQSAQQSITCRERLRKWLHAKVSIIIGVVEEYSFEIILIVTTSFNILYWTWLFVGSEYFNWSLDDTHNANGGYHKYEERMGQQLMNYWN